MKIGVLALQGDYEKHAEKLRYFNLSPLYIKKEVELNAIDALIIPGGESTTILKLLDSNFYSSLRSKIEYGVKILATCAGLILLAKEVENPKQKCLGVLDVKVERNAYGSQLNSFISKELQWHPGFKSKYNTHYDSPLEGVFIRAPKITRVGKEVETIVTLEKEPVLVRQGNIWAASFHPELSLGINPIYQIFLNEVRGN